MSEQAERIEEAIIRCRNLEEDAAPRAQEGLPNEIALAQGEINVASHVRELLEEELPGGPQWPTSLWNCELSFQTQNKALFSAKHIPSNVHEWSYENLTDALQVGIAAKVEMDVLDGTRVE